MYDAAQVNDFESPADLSGKNIALVSGTTGAAYLQEKNDNEKLGLKLLVTGDNNSAMGMLEKGEVAAIFQDDAQLAGLKAKSKSYRSDQFVISGHYEHHDPYGCMFTLGDEKFGAVVDQALGDYAKSDAMSESYRKWFVHPIESLGGINLKLPMSRGTREARDTLKNG